MGNLDNGILYIGQQEQFASAFSFEIFSNDFLLKMNKNINLWTEKIYKYRTKNERIRENHLKKIFW